jgi:hypothetical protein
MADKYPFFEQFYSKWRESFKRPFDPIVLFYHWILIHQDYRCVYDSQVDFKLIYFLNHFWRGLFIKF